MEFDDTRDAEDAVRDMNGERLCGERVTIEMAKGIFFLLLFGVNFNLGVLSNSIN